MAYTFIHHPMSTAEIAQKQQLMTEFITGLVDKITIIDPSLKFKEVILSGSVAEDLKIRQPDEFDFLLVLETEFEILETEDNPPGFVSIKGKQLFLHPLKLRVKFIKALFKTVKQFYPKGKVIIHYTVKGVAVKLQVDNIEGLSGLYDVDLVLALKDPDFWPPCAIGWKTKRPCHVITGETIVEVLNAGVHLVPRNELKSQPKQEGGIFRWRVSFSIAEMILLKTLTDEQGVVIVF